MSKQENLVSEMLKRCEYSKFLIHNCTVDEAKEFVGLVGEPRLQGAENTMWYSCIVGKIEAIAFLKDGEVDESDN